MGTTTHRSTTQRDRGPDESVTPRDGDGYTLIELLLVVTILGVLGSVVWIGVSGMATEAADTGCLADRHQLHVATEAFFAQTGSTSIPATGTDDDRHERTLVDGGYLRSVSQYHHVTADGGVVPEAPSC